MTSEQATKRVKLALVSSGLGNTRRGFEISTGRWFEVLKEHTDLDVRLFAGGNYPGARKLWNFPRGGIWTKLASLVPNFTEQNRWEFGYGAEQLSFWSAVNFQLLAWRPDVVWVKDVPLVHLLHASRIAFGLRYKLIFANGAKFKPQTYEHFDLIQQIQPGCYDQAINHGISPDKMELLSNCFRAMPVLTERLEQRAKLNLSANDFVVVCVAAWNKYHKRIDYLLREVASIPNQRVKLVLCGTPEVDTRELKEMGQALLGNRVQWLTVDESEIPSILTASDVFVLPSLQEGLGNALIEAALLGLPIVTHPHDGARYSIDDEYWFEDLSQPGNLAGRLVHLIDNPVPRYKIEELQSRVSTKFDETTQAAQFERMVLRVLGAPITRVQPSRLPMSLQTEP